MGTAAEALNRLQLYEKLRQVGIQDPESVINERLGIKDTSNMSYAEILENEKHEKILKELLVTNFAVRYEQAINRIGKTCWFWFGMCVVAAWTICTLYYFDVVPPIFWWPIAAMAGIPVSQMIRNLVKFCSIDGEAFDKLKELLEKEVSGYRTVERIIEYMKKGMGIQ